MNERQKNIVQNLKKSDDIHCLNAAFEIEMMCVEMENLRQIIDEKSKNIDKRLEEAISTMNDIKEMREKAKKTKGGISILSIAETTVMDGFKITRSLKIMEELK